MRPDACQYFYKCTNCGTILKPKQGDCCVLGSIKKLLFNQLHQHMLLTVNNYVERVEAGG